MKWEYVVSVLAFDPDRCGKDQDDMFEEFLNEHGEQGWEAIKMDCTSSGYFCNASGTESAWLTWKVVCKRPKEVKGSFNPNTDDAVGPG